MRNEELVIGNYKNCSLLITNYSLLMGVGDYSAYASSLGFFCFGWWGWGRGGIILLVGEGMVGRGAGMGVGGGAGGGEGGGAFVVGADADALEE